MSCLGTTMWSNQATTTGWQAAAWSTSAGGVEYSGMVPRRGMGRPYAVRNFAKTPPEISVGFDELDVPEVFRRLVDDLGASEQLTADPPISSYVGVRPSAHGTISVYVHKASVSLALEPERARTAAPRTGGSLQKKNPTTWFLRLSSEMLASPEDYDFALKLAREAVAKSIAGPAYE